MTGEVTVRRLRPDEWRAFRELRLAALRNDPLAFGSTAEREGAYSDEKWREWAASGSVGVREATFLALGPGDRPVGMLGVFTADERLHLWGMWVDPACRGRGVGRALLAEALGWVDRERPGSAVMLDVNPTQGSAVRAYLSSGFTYTGVERPLGHHPPSVTREMARVSPARS
jgi:ribosomal protein S18 acetylase RimI-like enzyme